MLLAPLNENTRAVSHWARKILLRYASIIDDSSVSRVSHKVMRPKYDLFDHQKRWEGSLHSILEKIAIRGIKRVEASCGVYVPEA